MSPAASEPRIAPVEPPYSAELQQDFDRIMRGQPPIGIFRTVARNPRALSRMVAGGLLDRGSISVRQRELVILRTCALCGAEYEWGVHVAAFNAKAGFSAEQLAATVHGDAASPLWSHDEGLLLQLCDSLQRTQDVDDTLWAGLKTVFDDAQLVELLMLAGLYRMVSYLVNGTRMRLEAGAPRFPASPRG